MAVIFIIMIFTDVDADESDFQTRVDAFGKSQVGPSYHLGCSGGEYVILGQDIGGILLEHTVWMVKIVNEGGVLRVFWSAPGSWNLSEWIRLCSRSVFSRI